MNAIAASDGAAPVPHQALKKNPATVMVVEDSPVQAELLRRALVAAGYRVIIAVDGAAGQSAAPGRGRQRCHDAIAGRLWHVPRDARRCRVALSAGDPVAGERVFGERGFSFDIAGDRADGQSSPSVIKKN